MDDAKAAKVARVKELQAGPLSYIEKLEPMRMTWSVFPKRYTPSGPVPEPRTPRPTSPPVWLQGAIFFQVPCTEAPSKYSPLPEPCCEPERSPSSEPRGSERAAQPQPSGTCNGCSSKESTEPRGTPCAGQAGGRQQVKSDQSERTAAQAKKEADLQAKEAEAGRRQDQLAAEVDRILRVTNDPLDWIRVLSLEKDFSERDLERRKKGLFLLLHPDKSSSFADQLTERGVDGVDRIRQAFNLVNEAYEKAKKWLLKPTFFRSCNWRVPSAPAPKKRPEKPPEKRERERREHLLRCAHPMCSYAVTREDFGGFCCKRCHQSFGNDASPQHGHQCEKLVPPATAKKSDPIPPEKPIDPRWKARQKSDPES
ncbi:Vesicular GABA transporter [Durusdinium trenchii]|uniref:Vesicular GABA transporter n=1 Tax=Durusdinium trenchii TaxID=1381693 RepID=A0ABP0PGK5_9DINO